MELVEGITENYLIMQIIRDDNGLIDKVIDADENEVEIQMLAHSFLASGCDGGFTYKGEFIEMEDYYQFRKDKAARHQRFKSRKLPKMVKPKANPSKGSEAESGI
ncbi:MAG: hypothetical protein PF518_07585 [Spirochaetaceae bacterium]|jgi:3-methyladenine DNA glycosylase Mpg|nr:hypothetical protein [Spirochaetaceae bacterium]